jgi:nucleotide sugar dehydrogenase
MTKKISQKYKKRNIVVIGAGYIGAVLSAVLSDKGELVTAIDINQEIISKYQSGRSPFNEPGLDELINRVVNNGQLSATTDFAVVANADVILITVGTPLMEDGNADKNAINQAISAMLPYIKDGQLVIVKSTVPPLTTENDIAKPLRQKANVRVAFCPERLAEGNAIEECLNIPVVVGGVDHESGEMAAEFWKTSLGVECIKVNNSTAAELVKLADNAWIDLNIALAFELAKVADQLDIDVLPVIKASNSLPKGEFNVNILLPSVGVGGYCLTKDPLFLSSFAKSLGTSFQTAVTSREINNQSPIYAANRLHESLQNQFSDLKVEDITIGVLGLAFKNDTGDCRFTPTLNAIHHLVELGYKVKIYDPYVSEKDYSMFKRAIKANSIVEILKDAHAIAFFCGHTEFKKIKNIDFQKFLSTGAIIFDGRMFFSEEQISHFKKSGFIFKGVGR